MKMTAEKFAQDLASTLGAQLVSVSVYGSAASQEQMGKYSDVNILIVVDEKSPERLKAIRPVMRSWIKAGHAAPLVFTEKELREAEDVFPIEFKDIQDARRILYGVDHFVSLTGSTKNLRHQLEYELRGKYLHLVRTYLSMDGRAKDVQDLLAKSVSSFWVLFRAVLRLVGAPIPLQRDGIGAELNKHVPIDIEALALMLALRHGEPMGHDVEKLFGRFLSTVERVIEFVDKYK